MTETTNEVKPTLTYAQKQTARAQVLFDRISKDTAEYNSINAELANLAAIEALAAGALVTVKTGRKVSAEKDTTQIRDGVVLGVKTEESGKRLFRVQVGAGFDTDIVNVGGDAITVKPVEVAEPTNEPTTAE